MGTLLDRPGDALFDDAVQSRGGFVQNQDVGISQKGASECSTLTLSAGQLNATVTDLRIEPVSQPFDKGAQLHVMERREELLFIDRTVEPERQVLPQGPIQQPDL